MADHLLNLHAMAGVDLASLSLLRFEGREALSEPFDYRLELVCREAPGDIRRWIGQLAEWDITTEDDAERRFAGRIFETDISSTDHGQFRIHVRVRPAYHATAYARATHFIQDKSALEIFDAMVADVPGLATDISLSPAPPKQTYAVRYDETEFEFLQRLLAQDGIFYFFTYAEAAGAYHHTMHVGNAARSYLDVPDGDDIRLTPGSESSKLTSLAHTHRARPSKHDFHGLDVRKVDAPFAHSASAVGDWGRVYPHSYEDLIGEAVAAGDVNGRGARHGEGYAQAAETIVGSGRDHLFFAGGRIKAEWPDRPLPARIVLTSVSHSAFDPWMLVGGGDAIYSNSFTAMDASKPFRPALPHGRRRAAGPVLGVVSKKGSVEGQAVVDDLNRIPVAVTHAREYTALPDIVWLPVQQAWASGTHGAQFFPRIGTRVVIDFLYGDPDMPFVSGTLYTPSAKYPFDPQSKVTQTGWRSVTDKNGGVTQELMFEDKPGGEEVYLYTGRDYRRLVDNDETGTVKRDQTLTVERDQKETIQRDQTMKIENDRKIDVTGIQQTTVQKTQTVTVTQKSLHESLKEIELVVGTSSIKLAPDGITIKAAKITVEAEGVLTASAGGQATLKAAITELSASGMMTVKGSIVMIN
ncbi:type VI secretion system tip protein VgrG [Microvirga sp. SRT01]|uniref:Type VI secretion system tip protein VgrG n=1 Tax=Sphingomonas longa TaxID=2778730 RepID=A0ABS2D2E7_9SPHN|nr:MULTISPECIES: type VI secretion system tip protein TssI/VgrG [Alphaproteobacteria]MBM6575092.1 type VI secretion system tip protein VgrG [Sphingomonas sp. BT552]MBR7708143.1 type VI secretion system tip protein VgrG [Microvirga sp. SRT01]